MKCYGIEMARVCEALAAGANGSEWCPAVKVLGQLRREIPPERASRLYIHWGCHADIEARKKHSAEVQNNHGCKCVVLRCLSFAKKKGLVESRGPAGVYREYQLTNKGKKLLEGDSLCQR